MQEGTGVDVVSGGELYTALSVGFPAENIVFHGNNKTRDELMMAVENGTLKDIDVKWADESACCVMIASGGYPEAYEKGKVITFGNANEMAQIYHSGTANNAAGEIVTAGGRVLGVSCVRPTLEKAIEAAYEASREIHFEGMHMRTDIGKRALECLK